MDVVKALREHSEAGATIVDLLYGDAGTEVSKALTEFGKKKTTQEKIAIGGNVLGLTAGTAAVAPAVGDVRRASRAARGMTTPGKAPFMQRAARKAANSKGFLKPLARPLTAAARNPKKLALIGAGSALGLQGANIAGDAVVGSVLNKKPKKTTTSKSLGVEIYTEISKLDVDKRQVFGWASVTKMGGIEVVDLQGDFIPLDEIEKAAYDFVKDSRVGGNMHRKELNAPIHVSDMIESFVVTPEKKTAMGLPDDAPEGWWVGFKVNDDATWEAAKEGRLAGFSIHGHGVREPLEVSVA